MKMITVNIIFILLSIVNFVNCVNDVGGPCRLSIECTSWREYVGKCIPWQDQSDPRYCWKTCGTQYCSFPKSNV